MIPRKRISTFRPPKRGRKYSKLSGPARFAFLGYFHDLVCRSDANSRIWDGSRATYNKTLHLFLHNVIPLAAIIWSSGNEKLRKTLVLVFRRFSQYFWSFDYFKGLSFDRSKRWPSRLVHCIREKPTNLTFKRVYGRKVLNQKPKEKQFSDISEDFSEEWNSSLGEPYSD